MSRPPSVAIVVPSFDRGGLEQVALNLYRGYRARGCRCVVLVVENVAGYMLERLESPAHGIVLDRDEALFLEALAEHEVEVLHYHYATFGLPEARAMGLLTLYTIHNVYTWLEDGAFAAHAARVLEADRVIAVSATVRDYFTRRAGCAPGRVDLVPNGIDPAWLDAPAPLPDLGLPPGRFVFAVPATYFPVKHHALALRAAERLLERRRDFQLVFVGNVGDEAYAAAIARRALASPAAAHVTRLPCLAHEAMAAFYRDAVDCVLLPTLQEGCSNVVLEALALDLPMILTDVGNAREARSLSPRVRVVERTEAFDALGPERIAALAETGDTPNLGALVAAMDEAMRRRGEPADAEALALRRREIGLDRMVDAYHRLFRDCAPLAGAEAAQPWPAPPALAAAASRTLERLA